MKKRTCIGAALTVALALASAAPAAAIVSSTPAQGTPQLASSQSNVRQLVQCGDTMYAVGQFTSVEWGGKAYARANAFSFKASSPYTITSWNPRPNGEVNTVAFAKGSCATAYIGGHFTQVGASQARDIAAVSTSTGQLDGRFAHSAEAQVNNIQAHGSHLIVGGAFNAINGTNRKYLVSLNPATGQVDGFVNLRVSATYIYNQQLSHNGNYDLVEASGLTKIGGKSRAQIAMLNLSRSKATVTRWTSPGFSHPRCALESFFVRAASWSPDDRTIYIATTGLRAGSGYPLTGLCDVAAALPATHASVKPKWVNYTGCDSLYSTAADSTTAYFGGHERWVDNPRGCNFAGPGAVSAQGIQGLSASSGKLVWHPGRARGVGADDMLLTQAGLWIASDNYSGGMCGGQPDHAGICFFK
jgi:hypothetical protein